MNNPQHRASRSVLAITLAWCAALVPGGAAAVESGAIRMAPGWSGGELALPLLPGVTGTVGVMHYESKQLKDNDGNSPQVPVGAGLNAALSGSARATVVIPRIVWISEHKLFGGYLGAGALIPFFDRKQSFSLAGRVPARHAGACNGGYPVAARHAGDGPWGEHQRAGRSRGRADHLLGGGPHERGPRRIHDLSAPASTTPLRPSTQDPATTTRSGRRFPLGMRATAGTPAREWRWPSTLATATPM